MISKFAYILYRLLEILSGQKLRIKIQTEKKIPVRIIPYHIATNLKQWSLKWIQ